MIGPLIGFRALRVLALAVARRAHPVGLPSRLRACLDRRRGGFRSLWQRGVMLLALATVLSGAQAVLTATDPLADRMHRLTQDLRCLVCQNESLADSHAPLAMDLKREIRARMEQGDSDAQIRDFLQQRYGDFVNYNPPLKATTLVLWMGPLLLLAAGGFVVWRTVRGRVVRHQEDGGSVEDSARRTS